MASNNLISHSSSYQSQKATAADLSGIEKLDTIPAILTVLANTFAAIFTGAVRSKTNRAASLYKYVTLTAIRTFVRRTSVRQQHYLAPPTDDAYAAACKKRGVAPDSVILEDGTRAHWVGSSKAEKIIINFHGGGYVLPASSEMFDFLFQVVDILSAHGKSASVLFLSYDLAPGATYPRQLQQAASLLNHVLQDLRIDPRNIVLTGDSAGANLALSLLSHISHLHPSGIIPTVDLRGQKLAGAALLSPWVDFDTSAPSFTRNKYKDCVEPAALHRWSAAFLNEPYPHAAKLDNYNQPTIAPESWWEGLPVEAVLVLAGDEEALVDGIVKFVEKLKSGLGAGKVEIVVAKGEFHDQPNLDVQLGYKESEEGEQARLFKRWIGSKL